VINVISKFFSFFSFSYSLTYIALYQYLQPTYHLKTSYFQQYIASSFEFGFIVAKINCEGKITWVGEVQYAYNMHHLILNSTLFSADEWTMEEKVVFERAFHMHGKHFHRIKAFVSVKCFSTVHMF